AAAQAACSSFLMAREAFAMSIVASPRPAQNCFRPAPEPPDSTIGVLNFENVLPKRSATMLAYGSTVEEPATLTWSRPASAAPAKARVPATATADDRAMNLMFTLIS